MGTEAWFIISVAVLVIIILLLIKSSNSQSGNKEGFLLTSQNAYVSPETGAIKGPGIMTDGMTRMPLDEISKRVNSNGFVSDGAISLGVDPGNGFNKVYESQLEIQDIDDRNVNGYQSIDDLDRISRRIASNNNNANNCMYTRAGSKPTKMVIEQNGIRGVIDEKYLPDRDKNHKIATVQTVIPIQGYDVNIERMGEHLLDTHFSKISKHGKEKRIPTAAGAIGGAGNKINNGVNGLSDDVSPNKAALEQSISLNGNNIAIKDALSGGTVLTPLDSGAGAESYRQHYVRGNSR